MVGPRCVSLLHIWCRRENRASAGLIYSSAPRCQAWCINGPVAIEPGIEHNDFEKLQVALLLDCFRGSERIDAVPTGTVITLHGLPTYIAEPGPGRSAAGIVVVIPDAFGWEFVNNRLLADEYARKGDFVVYMPDFMNGHACPLWVIEPLDTLMRAGSLVGILKRFHNLVRTVYGFGPFLYMNRQAVTMPRVTQFLMELRKAEAAKLPVGIAGFCWGGLHAIHLAVETASDSKPLVDVVFTAHPSSVSFPEHIDRIRKPISVAIGDKDPLMTPKQTLEAEAILKKNNVDHEVVTYEGAGHGFSVRIDRTNPKQTEQAIQAEVQAVRWFTKQFTLNINT